MSPPNLCSCQTNTILGRFFRERDCVLPKNCQEAVNFYRTGNKDHKMPFVGGMMAYGRISSGFVSTNTFSVSFSGSVKKGVKDSLLLLGREEKREL